MCGPGGVCEKCGVFKSLGTSGQCYLGDTCDICFTNSSEPTV